ncbi:hypothetical protein HON52_00430 [Candidatus Uhrbacteria bacterium]|jgi:glucose/mannose-6-phosphate isomerase|nr:hypothetical protein [Candidatus Uhrbacteria bacterium]
MLDDEKVYKRYDKDEVAFGIERLSEQVQIAWQQTRRIQVPKAYRGVENIVVAGMGGSALGIHVIVNTLSEMIKKPVIITRDYRLPGFVNSKTLVILSSFSGGTEEILYAGREAKKRKAKMMVITTGGKLAAFGKREKLPMYNFEPGDLAKQPRLGVGFTLAGTLGLLQRAGMVKVGRQEIDAFASAMSEVVDTCALDVKVSKNPAKTVAQEIEGRPILIVASEHLSASAHIMRNQISETGKQFVECHKIPKMNHYFMEGLTYPKGFVKKFVVVMLKSKFYHRQNQKRYDITAELFEKLGAKVVEYDAGGGSRFAEAGELLQFSTFTSYYLAMLNKVNPIKIPYVDWFKEELSK